MNGTQFTLVAYAIGLGMLLAYGLRLWVQFRLTARDARRAAVRVSTHTGNGRRL